MNSLERALALTIFIILACVLSFVAGWKSRPPRIFVYEVEKGVAIPWDATMCEMREQADSMLWEVDHD